MSPVDLTIYAVVGFVMSILSGIAGAGGGFVMTPLLIFLGLSPAEAVATGKISGLAVTVGSLGGLKTHKVKNRKLVYLIMALAFVIGLFAPLAIKGLEDDSYRNALGIILLLMVPVLLINKPKVEGAGNSPLKKVLGFGGLLAALGLQAVFSSGLGSLVNIVLIALLGLSPLDAIVTKRMSQILLNSVIILGVLGSGLIIWPVAAIGVVICLAGGFIGSKIALKRGDEFIKRVLVTVVVAAALGLLFGG